VLVVSILPVSTSLRLDIGTVMTVWYFFDFYCGWFSIFKAYIATHFIFM